MKKLLSGVLVLLSFSEILPAQGGYSGSGSVTRGPGTVTTANLYQACNNGRVAAVGSITSSDGKTWVVPAQTSYATAPRLPDLYNECSGVKPANIGEVNAASLPVTVIDQNGDLVTGYLFGDNYFELYVNGVLVGVDPMPYTPFNSCMVRFRVSKPYTLAVRLVDWEENLGLGSENNNGNLYHAGDGGFIAQFSDGTVTDSSWRAQTYYIAPIQDLTKVVELPDGTRSSAGASTSPGCNADCYGIHYDIPADWNQPGFNDKGWPRATLYTAATVGVNFPAYQNVSGLWNNARFIWSSNLILDNLVLVRKTVGGSTATSETASPTPIRATSPFRDELVLFPGTDLQDATVTLYDLFGRQAGQWRGLEAAAGSPARLPVPAHLPPGLYLLTIRSGNSGVTLKVIHAPNP